MGNYIISDPDILGGIPVIKGTRVSVGRILFLLKDGYTLEEIHEDYPHIDIQMLSAAIDEVIGGSCRHHSLICILTIYK